MSPFNLSSWHYRYIGPSSWSLWSQVTKNYMINHIRASPSYARITLFSWFCSFTHLLFIGSCGNPDAKRLYDDLLSNYNKLVRPVVNVTDAVTVKLKLKLSQLIDVVSWNWFDRSFWLDKNLWLLATKWWLIWLLISFRICEIKSWQPIFG